MRKVLGQHEIATVQTTSTDRDAGIINLTTVLAHASGEWIASDWPVCSIGDFARPQNMGAALTYARRYALFTLVGIAGEDDLDAPDLAVPPSRTAGSEKLRGGDNRRLNGGVPAPTRGAAPRRTKAQASPVAILKVETSAELRDRLIAELNKLGSSDEAALWAHCSLSEKNRLTAGDAKRVEEAFQTRLAALAAGTAEVPEMRQQAVTPPREDAGEPTGGARSKVIDKSVLALPVPRRVRDRDHVKSVAKKPCLILRATPLGCPPPPVSAKPSVRAQSK